MKSKGFTLIELLIVIAILAILFGVTLNVVNVNRNRERAEDAVRQSNFSKILYAIESFEAAEDHYPAMDDELQRPDERAFFSYLNNWPTEPSGSEYRYWSNNNLGNTEFGLVVQLSSNSDEDYLKFRSGWTSIQICSNKDPAEDSCN